MRGEPDSQERPAAWQLQVPGTAWIAGVQGEPVRQRQGPIAPLPAQVAVAGTAPIGDDGTTVGQGDVYAQTVRCLDIAETALKATGATLTDAVRTRIMLTDVTRWEEAAQAHGERFTSVRPACTFVEVSRFIDPDWLVEVELDAILV